MNILIQHMIFADIGMGEDKITKPLRMTQSAAMADHQPAMGSENRDMIGDCLGVGRPDTDIDQRNAHMFLTDQMISGHLGKMAGGDPARRLIRQVGVRRNDISRLDKGAILAPFQYLFLAIIDKFIDITLIVGEQHEALEMLRYGAGVMGQAGEGVIHPFRRKKR